MICYYKWYLVVGLSISLSFVVTLLQWIRSCVVVVVVFLEQKWFSVWVV